ncbi:MAG TPA: GNAT family N-acetyltransferase [Nocardioides sp.]|uniref:GNAT family N-acetyltransferase n=1 Tax=Nocardioides sp. TaxID=35761 RepID=UPI002C4C893E|nr:GNAT family N-acetyltransferase [Nocardioides sp.]HTW17910.1 GNAT family N-acetyltransferase [Nocardioides sp.]
MKATLEPLDLDRDLALVHAWVTHPRSVYWEMQGASVDEVAAEYARIVADPHHQAWLGRVDGEPAFLAETYDPAHSPLASLPEIAPGDLGMHVLVAPTDSPVPGFTRLVFRAVMEHCFADTSVRRVVVEPDVRNDRIGAMNAAFGFVVARVVDLGSKTAALSFCTRSAFEGPTAHLSPERLATAQRHLVAKAISEYAHERIVTPVADADAWRLAAPDGGSSYTFRARRLALEHWAIEEDSLTRWVDGAPADLDVQAFVAEFAGPLGIPDPLLPTYLEELASTLASACWKLAHSSASVAQLLEADYQELEAAMTEGHPGFVANNGRIGYDLADYAAYAPETGSAVRLEWLAARRSLTRLSLGQDLSEARLYDGELDASVRASFSAVLRGLGLDPDDYLYVPVHPWQWRHQLAITFAPDLARRDLVHLGTGPDDYRAQQSIRTFFNTTRPERHYVKTALSIQNMGFKRGLSPRYMAATPAINDWVHRLVEDDPTLKGCGFTVLRERAAIGYTGDAFHALDVRSPYQKMVAALWRESPVPLLSRGERLASMTSLLHRDASGAALVTAMIEASPMDASGWVRSYLHAYVRPIVHCLLAHELAFMPHGENLVLVLRDHVPVRALMKDVGEEVCVMDSSIAVPEEVERVRADVPQDIKALALHTDVFDGFLRHLAAILDTDGVLPEAEFWAEVRRCVEQHAEEHPELAAQVEAYDLQRPEFRHSCLNRLQLLNTLEMVDITDQASSLQYAGTLVNPIAADRHEVID